MQARSRVLEAAADTALRSLGVNGAQDRTGLRNMQQLIQLRWIAVVGQVVTIFVVHYGIGIALPLGTMCAVLAALVAFNLGSQQWWKRRAHVSNLALLVGLLVDVISLSIQLYLSGGITNPFVFLYLLQVALGTVLLRSPANWILAAAAGVCFTALAVLPTPLHIAADPGNGLADHYVQGLLICFLLVAALLVVFITRIGRILRERDARLAELRQRAAEEEHIVRMGLLASGAAHELGTPLSTLSVILGDWQHLPSIASETELHHDVAEMLAQVARCKSIVTNILLSAGETRGESPVETTLHELLDDLADEWRAARTPAAFEYQRRCEDDPSIVSDEGLRQMVFNVLDNALEASPAWVALDADCRDGELVIQVSDAGPGFSADVLERLGTPYNSSKGRPGGGLGLFLSVNVARTLGGRLTARNQPQGGAVVTVTLPLSAIALEEHGDDE
ncbi:ATP-binding protein [Lysobacter sp. Root559]|uniref:ATP-binding protein n=1 Tax=Lysobacter sp. Root559 TaxID=1736559 RepID=UPI0009EB2DDD|nr:ATP-binding protein [Lysobacter sp. Root559]